MVKTHLAYLYAITAIIRTTITSTTNSTGTSTPASTAPLLSSSSPVVLPMLFTAAVSVYQA